ncbi:MULTISPECIES: SDR family oxidoreductase [unclassified Afipia]|uniref:SDR family NAD(P)-dependent oxidoreductase n=1 Tax=unclassified Afipia TaxID=2642050 RepID=UPI000424F1C3|nr:MULTISPECIES: SDR family oxidoreductase [unclassified Afipia]
MQLNLKDKAVIVTGAASNIGRGIALAFAQESACVAIVDIDLAGAERVVQEALARGASKAIAVKADVSNWDEVQSMSASVEREFGCVDILVNNAGWVVDRLFVEKPRAEWEKEIQVNLWGMINCTRAVLDGMIARSRGVVVSIASDAGRIGEYREGVYGACKAGVIALSKTLARENGRHNIRLNVVCPGTTLPGVDEEVSSTSLWSTSEMKVWLSEDMRGKISKAYPLRRLGTPEDIASAVLFFASDASSFVTGQTLSVSGGYSMV